MLFWVSSLIFYSSYLFSVFFLSLLIIFMMMVYFSSMVFVKFLVILVYVSGVVIFVLYISCMCWFSSSNLDWVLILAGGVVVYIFDSGLFFKISDVGEFLWEYLLIGCLFNSLVMVYSLNLFKVSGSLRL